jgi:hypothetical protein
MENKRKRKNAFKIIVLCFGGAWQFWQDNRTGYIQTQ